MQSFLGLGCTARLHSTSFPHKVIMDLLLPRSRLKHLEMEQTHNMGLELILPLILGNSFLGREPDKSHHIQVRSALHSLPLH